MSGYTFDFINNAFLGNSRASLLGGGLPGSVPLKDLGNTLNSQGGLRVGSLLGGGAGPNSSSGMDGGNSRGMDRKVLRNAFGNSARDFTGYRDRDKFRQALLSQGVAATDVDFVINLTFISPLSLSNPSNLSGKYFEQSFVNLNNKGSLCGQFRAATSLGDVRNSINGGGKQPDKWWGEASNPLAGKSLNGKKLGDSFKSSNLSVEEFISVINNSYNFPPFFQKGGASYCGNPRFVSDSSEFTRFKRLKAKTKTYNDKSFGGSLPQNAISAIARVRG